MYYSLEYREVSKEEYTVYNANLISIIHIFYLSWNKTFFLILFLVGFIIRIVGLTIGLSQTYEVGKRITYKYEVGTSGTLDKRKW